MSALPSAYARERISEARKILAEPGTGPTLRWLAELFLKQVGAAA